MRRISRAPTLLIATMALYVAACGSASGSNPTSTPPPPVATATPDVPDLTVFRGFDWPIHDACLPQGDQLMPNAPRDYRGGIHEGVDFYGYDNCTRIVKGTAILAAKDGTVIRADHDYQPLTEAQLLAIDQRISEGHANDPDILDTFRGRQVWIDHGKGIVTRYAHTSDVAADIHVGDAVQKGDIIAFVGDSGTPESISDPGVEEHLHFELRVGDGYLGQGLPPDEVRALYEHLFAPVDAP